MPIKVTSILLVGFILQGTNCNSSGASDMHDITQLASETGAGRQSNQPTNEANVGTESNVLGQLSYSNTEGYAQTLHPDLKHKIISVLDETSLREPLSKRIGSNEARNKVDLMLIDLYRIFYKIHEPGYREQKALASNKTDTVEEQTIKDYPLFAKSFQDMSRMMLGAVNMREDFSIRSYLQKYSGGDRPDWYLQKEYEVLVAIKDGYIIPLNKYASGGDFDTLQQAVNIGRQQVYQALISFREAAKR